MTNHTLHRDDWNVRHIPAAWYHGRCVEALTGYHQLVHGLDYGRRFTIADFTDGGSRVVPLDEIEVEVVTEVAR